MKCPACGRDYPRLLAVSRRDSNIMICDDCGAREAIEDLEAMTGESADELREAIKEVKHETD